MTTVVPATIHPDSRRRRAVDVAVAGLGLVTLSPALLVVALWVRATSPGPAFYHQTRVGRDEKSFEIWKFRTMVVDADRDGPAVAGAADARITDAGRRLRRSRFDELPQLVNLLLGDLTLIGPRPEVAPFIPFYTARERDILTVRPGILGPGALLFAETQSGALDEVADPEAYYVAHHLHTKLALDLAYLESRTLSDDLRLLRRTLGVLGGRAGGRP